MVDQPTWSKRWLSASDIQEIEQAIAAVETKTNAEIVPMLVASSSTTGHVPWLISAYSLTLLLVIDAVFDLRRYTDDYGIWLTVGLAVTFALGYWLSGFSLFQRFAITPIDRDIQVNQRAELEFFEAGLQKTENRTGILLMISVMEHRAVVIADKSIADKVPADTWKEVVAILVAGAKDNKLGAAFVTAIAACGDIVYPHFPLRSGDKNELLDHLVIKD